MSKPRPTTADRRSNRPSSSGEAAPPEHYSRGTRETIESVVIAIILAFLFRSFVGEAFVIPTGSMAPTLQGKHKDVRCVICDYPYRTGASVEDSEKRPVVSTTCPNCRYTMSLDPGNANHVSFTGDRIVVSKFSFDLSEPKRWDVIVFKYPGNAKQNYIKRLVGLPGETLRIRHGDIFVKREEGEEFQIARKPEHKLLAMLHVVHDSDYVAEPLREVGWPTRWQPWAAPGDGEVWSQNEGERGRGFVASGTSQQPAWLRYQHVVPHYEDWYDLVNGRAIPSRDQLQGQLITDFYAYNAYGTGFGLLDSAAGGLGPRPDHNATGLHWVGDLALECTVEIENEQGQLWLKLVEGGVHFDCRIDVATGEAELTMVGGQGGYGEDGQPVARPTASTAVRGPGRYQLRFANVDDEIWLWVNNRRVKFSSPTTFRGPSDLRPQWSPEEYGDLAPLGVGTQGVQMKVEGLRVLRDVYYIATIGGPTDRHYAYSSQEEILSVFTNPTTWPTTHLFDWDASGPVQFEMGEDQFFPLGDNSPQSKDARLWEGDPFVERQLLTGKALFIYWPHAWNRPVPFWPNFSRMGFIR